MTKHSLHLLQVLALLDLYHCGTTEQPCTEVDQVKCVCGYAPISSSGACATKGGMGFTCLASRLRLALSARQEAVPDRSLIEG